MLRKDRPFLYHYFRYAMFSLPVAGAIIIYLIWKIFPTGHIVIHQSNIDSVFLMDFAIYGYILAFMIIKHRIDIYRGIDTHLSAREFYGTILIITIVFIALVILSFLY